MKRNESRDGAIYFAYAVTTVLGFFIARLSRFEVMRYAFMYYLIAFFVFTGLLPYLVSQKRKGEKGFAWNLGVKIVFPALALVGTALVASILLKIRGR